jgi:hypothetical protein
MYQEYTEIIEKLQDPRLDSDTQEQLTQRLGEIENALESVGIEPAGAPAGSSTS